MDANERHLVTSIVDLFGGEVIRIDPAMPRQTYIIAPGTIVSIKPANDTGKLWKAYITQKEAIGECVSRQGDAMVIEVGGWLILTQSGSVKACGKKE